MKKKMALVLATLLVGAAALTACGGGDSKSAGAAAAAGDAVVINLNASNFEFDQKEIKVKKGQTVKLSFTNKQGMHNVAIPDLKVKADKAGTPVEFVADKAGTFEFKCDFVCGEGHANMVGKLIVE